MLHRSTFEPRGHEKRWAILTKGHARARSAMPRHQSRSCSGLHALQILTHRPCEYDGNRTRKSRDLPSSSLPSPPSSPPIHLPSHSSFVYHSNVKGIVYPLGRSVVWRQQRWPRGAGACTSTPSHTCPPTFSLALRQRAPGATDAALQTRT